MLTIKTIKDKKQEETRRREHKGIGKECLKNLLQ